MHPLRTLSLCAVLASAGAAHAQTTLGELLDRGAQKLSAAQWQAMLPVSTLVVSADSDARLLFKPDGSVVGIVTNRQGHGSSDANGTWQADASGRRCMDLAMPEFRMRWQQCGFGYRLGDQLFHTQSDSDRAAQATAYRVL